MGKRINRPDHKGVLHFITINVLDHRRAFSKDEYARAALLQLRKQCDEHPAKLVAYVLMQEHLHAVLNPRDGEINTLLRNMKPAITNAIAEVAQQTSNQRVLDWLTHDEGHYQLWQEGKHDLYLYSNWMIWQKINYIHNNPIRRGFVQHAGEYPYSSFCAYYDVGLEPVIPVDRDWWWDDLPFVVE